MLRRIARLHAREILDSRGNPTVEVDVLLSDSSFGRAAVPSGASTGTHEAVELRDGEAGRFLGKGTRKAVSNVLGPIAKALRGKAILSQEHLDRLLVEADGTPQKGRLGANAILGVSMAFACAAAASRGRPLYRTLGGGAPLRLPVPLLNVINGGAHADNPLDMQELMLVPLGFRRFSEALRAAAETYHRLKGILKKKGLSTGVGDEGGFAPDLSDERKALDLMLEAIESAGYRPGRQIALALDVAGTELEKGGIYSVGGRTLDAGGMVELYRRLVRDYPLFSIEDGLAEEDWSGWKALTRAIGARTWLVGDDLYVTNPARLRRGIAERASNAILIKLNQIGTVSETLKAIGDARAAGFAAVVSHRSGETEDTFIADLAVGTGVGLIKTGAPCRAERVAKYNRLLRIEEELGRKAVYAGAALARG